MPAHRWMRYGAAHCGSVKPLELHPLNNGRSLRNLAPALAKLPNKQRIDPVIASRVWCIAQQPLKSRTRFLARELGANLDGARILATSLS